MRPRIIFSNLALLLLGIALGYTLDKEKNTARPTTKQTSSPANYQTAAPIVPPTLSPSSPPVPDASAESRRLRHLFSTSRILYINEAGALNETCGYLYQLTPAQLSAIQRELDTLRLGLNTAQKKAVVPLESSPEKQSYSIGDFSASVSPLIAQFEKALTEITDAERAKAITEGLKSEHPDFLCRLGEGAVRITFRPRDNDLGVLEERIHLDGTVVSSSQYHSSDLPIRYRDLFQVQATPK